MATALALANNDVAQIAWQYDAKLPGCLGFAVFRKLGDPDAAGDWTPLPAWVGFVGENNDAWTKRDTTIWPIQKYSWKDVTAQRGETYTYKIVPVSGKAGTGQPLTPDDAHALVTNSVTLTPDRGHFKTYFNRGILSTQFVSHAVPKGPSGAPNYAVLKGRIDQPGDPLRLALAGQILEGLELLLKKAETENGSCYAALYELDDPDLLSLLVNGKGLHVILSNTGPDDQENRAARQTLHAAADIEIIDRFVPGGHIGHNKFVVYLNAQGEPEEVLLGSTNWTSSAVCAQSNNALIVADPDLAAAYFSYWNRLKADSPPQGQSKQGADLREANQTPGIKDHPIDDGKATVWFSPNTEHARTSHPTADEATPLDLAEVFQLMEDAKNAILFLEFQPGHPSVVDRAAKIGSDRPDLFIRGAATDPGAVDVFNTTLVHRTTEDPVEVVPASAITDQFAFWQQELLKLGPTAHAIIHDKIIVIDPMSADCVVVTGSHNQGFRASYNNDENLLIVRGHQDLAKAYAVHVMDIYDHYRFRYQIQKNGTHAFSGLEPSDQWQDKYFDPGSAASGDNKLWWP
ncbi:phospholipase D-like domain-containing protein [Rhizobium calliandrae]|uniref:phospholipase D n=1 Tax=Rhizobium calliandrae TaxID=1312182 RepID=A0ABT7KLF6_9HYPH|nr:phospholipase D-like domain-containing protein [Rhizobium calliandrae]MDL2409461.1 phospholipase D-like domain-containing protein [Rhizobium calliandrae]